MPQLFRADLDRLRQLLQRGAVREALTLLDEIDPPKAPPPPPPPPRKPPLPPEQGVRSASAAATAASSRVGPLCETRKGWQFWSHLTFMSGERFWSLPCPYSVAVQERQDMMVFFAACYLLQDLNGVPQTPMAEDQMREHAQELTAVHVEGFARERIASIRCELTRD